VREGERLLNDGKDLAEVPRMLEISEATWNRWPARYGGLKATQAKRLKELEAVGQLQARFGVSQRRACRVAGQHRTTRRRPLPVRPGEEARLRARLRRIAREHPRLAWRVLRREPGRPLVGHQPQAHPAPCCARRAWVARSGAATAAGSLPSRPSGCGPSAQPGLGDRLPVRPDR